MFKINLQSLSNKLFYCLLVMFPFGSIFGFVFLLKTGYILNSLVLLLFLLVVNKLNKIDLIILFTIFLSLISVILFKVLVVDTSMIVVVSMAMQLVIIVYYYTLKGLFAQDNINIKRCINLIVNGAIFQAVIGLLLFYFARGFNLLLIIYNFDPVKFASAGGDLNKAAGLILNSNVYANYLLGGMILIILRNDKLKLMMLLQLTILFIAILSSGSRYAVVVSIIFILSIFFKKVNLKRILILLIVSVVILVFVVPQVNSIFSRRSYFYENRGDKNMIAINALNSNLIHYIVGVPNSEMLSIGTADNEAFSDNSYLALILNIGLPLTLYLLFVVLIKPLFKIAKNGFSVLFAIYLAVLLFITNCIYWYSWLFYIYFIIFYIYRKDAIRKKENYCEEYSLNS